MMRKLLLSAMAGATAIAASCGDSRPTNAEATAQDTVLAVFGNRQQWFTNTNLPDPITLRVSLSSGVVVRGVPVRVSDAAGFSTELITDADGLASFTVNARAQAGAFGLDVRIASRPVIANAITYETVPLESADMVVVHGLKSGEEFALVDFDASNRQTRRGQWPDTIRMYWPRNGSGVQEELAALGEAHPPLSFGKPWTPKPDTIHVNFGPPIKMPIAIWYMSDPRLTNFYVDRDMSWLESVFGLSMMGVSVGKVTVTVVSPTNGVISGCSSNLPGESADQLNVYYIPVSAPIPGDGILCEQRKILFKANSARTVAMLVGSSFNWQSTELLGNLMNATATASALTIGQILRAHFEDRSSLNALYRLNRPGLRNCSDINVRCLELSYDGQ